MAAAAAVPAASRACCSAAAVISSGVGMPPSGSVEPVCSPAPGTTSPGSVAATVKAERMSASVTPSPPAVNQGNTTRATRNASSPPSPTTAPRPMGERRPVPPARSGSPLPGVRGPPARGAGAERTRAGTGGGASARSAGRGGGHPSWGAGGAPPGGTPGRVGPGRDPARVALAQGAGSHLRSGSGGSGGGGPPRVTGAQGAGFQVRVGGPDGSTGGGDGPRPFANTLSPGCSSQSSGSRPRPRPGPGVRSLISPPADDSGPTRLTLYSAAGRGQEATGSPSS